MRFVTLFPRRLSLRSSAHGRLGHRVAQSRPRRYPALGVCVCVMLLSARTVTHLSDTVLRRQIPSSPEGGAGSRRHNIPRGSQLSKLAAGHDGCINS